MTASEKAARFKVRKTPAALDNELLFLVQGQDRLGRDAFYYVLVDKLKKDIFVKEIKNKNTDLRKYGKILISGFGLEPTADAKAYLKNEYDLTAL